MERAASPAGCTPREASGATKFRVFPGESGHSGRDAQLNIFSWCRSRPSFVTGFSTLIRYRPLKQAVQ